MGDFKTSSLAKSPTHLWLFDNASGSATIADYGSINTTLTVPAGVALGESGLLVGDSTTSAAVTGEAAIDLGSSINFDCLHDFCVEVLISHDLSSVSDNYAIIGNLKTTTPFNGWEMEFSPRFNLSDSNWISAQLFVRDATNVTITSLANANIPMGTTVHIVCNYHYNAGSPFAEFFIDGAKIGTPVTRTGTLSDVTHSDAGYMFRSFSRATPATVQAITTYNRVLTEAEVIEQYCALKNLPFNTHNLYSPFKGKDQNGDPLRLLNIDIHWDAGAEKYYAYGIDTSAAVATPQPDPNGFNIDFQPCDKYLVYSSRTLGFGDWVYEGVALDASGVSGIWSLTRWHVIWNAATNKWVGWGHFSTDQLYSSGSQYVLIAEADTSVGPFTIVDSAYLPNGNNPYDMNLFLDDNGDGYVVYRVDVNILISKLSADFHSTSGPATTLYNSSGHPTREAPAVFKRGSTYFCVVSSQEFYNEMFTNSVAYLSSDSPLGTWSAIADAFAVDPLGTGWNSQPASMLRLPSNPSRVIYFGDNYVNGDMDKCTIVPIEINFPTSSTLSMTAAKLVTTLAAGGVTLSKGSFLNSTFGGSVTLSKGSFIRK